MNFLKVFLLLLISSHVYAASEFKDIPISDASEIALISGHLDEADSIDHTEGCTLQEVKFDAMLNESDGMVGKIDLITNLETISINPDDYLFYFLDEAIANYDNVFSISPEEEDIVKSFSALRKNCNNGEKSSYYLRFPIQ